MRLCSIFSKCPAFTVVNGFAVLPEAMESHHVLKKSLCTALWDMILSETIVTILTVLRLYSHYHSYHLSHLFCRSFLFLCNLVNGIICSFIAFNCKTSQDLLKHFMCPFQMICNIKWAVLKALVACHEEIRTSLTFFMACFPVKLWLLP